MNLRRFTQRKAKDAELADEIDSHLAHEQDVQAARGVAADEARRRAHVKFGGRNTVREHDLPARITSTKASERPTGATQQPARKRVRLHGKCRATNGSRITTRT